MCSLLPHKHFMLFKGVLENYTWYHCFHIQNSLRQSSSDPIFHSVVANIKRNDCRLLHRGISISKKGRRRKLFRLWLPPYVYPRVENQRLKSKKTHYLKKTKKNIIALLNGKNAMCFLNRSVPSTRILYLYICMSIFLFSYFLVSLLCEGNLLMYKRPWQERKLKRVRES